MQRLGVVFFCSLLVFCATAQQQADTAAWNVQVEDVVVTATYAPTDVKNAIHNVRVLNQADIQRLQARTLEQLLVTDVNVRVEQDPQLGGGAELAGLGGQNIKLMIDGVPVVGRLNGNIDLSQIQLYDVERVEIVEGPLAVNYGTDALAGVINIITKKSQIEPYQIQLDASYEDRGEQTTSAGVGIRVTENILLRGQIGYDKFGGFDLDTTRQPIWNPKEQFYASASIRYRLSENNNLRYSFNFYDEEVTRLGNVQRPIFKPYAFDERFITKRNDHSLHYDGVFKGKYYINSFVAWNQWDRQVDHWRKDFETGEILAIPIRQDTSRINGYHTRTTFATQSSREWDFMIGLDSRYEDFQGGRIGGPDSTMSDYAFITDHALFSSVKYKLIDQKMIIEAGTRIAYNNRFNTPILPSLNVRYNMNDHWTFRASYGRGFRAPDIKELYFNFVDANHFILGNDGLKAETSNNIQAGLTYYRMHKGSEVTLGVQGFYNRIQDQINLYEYVETPNGRVPAVDTVTNNYTYFNLDEQGTTGTNIRFGYDREEVRIRVSYGLIGYYNSGYEDLEDVSPYSFTNEVSVDFRYTIPYVFLDAQLLFRTFDRRIQFYPLIDENGEEYVGQRIQDGFSTLDFSFGKSFLNDDLRLTVGVRNLLDIQTVNIVGDNSTMGIHNTSSASQNISTGRRWFTGLTYRVGWGGK